MISECTQESFSRFEQGFSRRFRGFQLVCEGFGGLMQLPREFQRGFKKGIKAFQRVLGGFRIPSMRFQGCSRAFQGVSERF